MSTTNKTKTAIGYTCTAEETGALLRHTEAIREYCERESIALDGVVSFVGSKRVPLDERAGLVLKETILMKGVDLLVVQSVACLGRDWVDIYNTLEWLYKHGVDAYILDHSYYCVIGGNRKPPRWFAASLRN